jgi:hypothetical protein
MGLKKEWVGSADKKYAVRTCLAKKKISQKKNSNKDTDGRSIKRQQRMR